MKSDKNKTHKLNKIILFTGILFFLTTAYNCSSVKNSMVQNKAGQNKRADISVLAGPSAGGFVDNTVLSGISGASETDAITGATSSAFNAGVHSGINIGGHVIETGVDYIGFKQSVTYDLSSFAVSGIRDIRFHQLRLPVTYNFRFFNNELNRPKLVVKGGLSLGYTFSSSITGSEDMPVYDFSKWDYGPTLGITLYPFNLKGQYNLGFYLDMYRGSKIFNDVYHNAGGVGNHSYMKFGLVFQPDLFF